MDEAIDLILIVKSLKTIGKKYMKQLSHKANSYFNINVL